MRKLSVARTRWAVAVAAVTLLVGLALAKDPGAYGKFQAFGNARLVSGGISPHERAADLTSDCTVFKGGPPPACDFTTFTFSGIAFIPKAPHSGRH